MSIELLDRAQAPASDLILADIPLVTPELLASPELRRAPAAFRTAVRISKDNWHYGSLSFMLPSGRAFRVQGKEAGPDALLAEGRLSGAHGRQGVRHTPCSAQVNGFYVCEASCFCRC